MKIEQIKIGQKVWYLDFCRSGHDDDDSEALVNTCKIRTGHICDITYPIDPNQPKTMVWIIFDHTRANNEMCTILPPKKIFETRIQAEKAKKALDHARTTLMEIGWI